MGARSQLSCCPGGRDKAHRAREKGGLGFQNLATQSAPQVATSNLQAIYGFLHLDTLALDPLEKGDV